MRTTGGVTKVREPYAEPPRCVGDWWLPADTREGPVPTVLLVHGGYWRERYDLTLEDAVAADLAARGFLVWNVDYRPSSDPWSATLTDVAAAADHLRRGRFADPRPSCRRSWSPRRPSPTWSTGGPRRGPSRSSWWSPSRPRRNPVVGGPPTVSNGGVATDAVLEGDP